jgi:hypothetical protein
MVGPELRKTAFFPKGRQCALGRETQLVFSWIIAGLFSLAVILVSTLHSPSLLKRRAGNGYGLEKKSLLPFLCFLIFCIVLYLVQDSSKKHFYIDGRWITSLLWIQCI